MQKSHLLWNLLESDLNKSTKRIHYLSHFCFSLVWNSVMSTFVAHKSACVQRCHYSYEVPWWEGLKPTVDSQKTIKDAPKHPAWITLNLLFHHVTLWSCGSIDILLSCDHFPFRTRGSCALVPFSVTFSVARMRNCCPFHSVPLCVHKRTHQQWSPVSLHSCWLLSYSCAAHRAVAAAFPVKMKLVNQWIGE